MKRLILCLLCFALLLSAGCASSPSTETEAAGGETETGETEMPIYAYLGPNYALDGDTLTASPDGRDAYADLYTGAYRDAETPDGYAAEVTVTLDAVSSSAGILFSAAKSTVHDGLEGYAFVVRDRRVYLYDLTGSAQTGPVANELAHKTIERPKTGSPIRLRVEKSGNTYRCYYLDDMEGVEPWPEFEYVLTDHRFSGVGVTDNGQGAAFSSLSVVPYESAGGSGAVYRNPVFGELQAADPGVLKVGDTYYCYSTSAPIGYYVYTSTDLVRWKNEGLCMDAAWGLTRSGYYWAPEVVQRADGKFVMVASVEEHIGFAVADSPLGPFVPEKNWLYDKSIDGHIFLDDDGRAYLLYVSWRPGHEYGIWGCELGEDLVTIRPGTEKLLIKPTDKWEKMSGQVTEGPFILKHNGLYYLTYSGTGYDVKEYAVGYAVADSPLGTYEKYSANPILSYTSKLYGPGHHSFTTSPDGSELIIVYHVHASTTAVHPRKVSIDRARFAPTASGVDRLEIFGPTHTAQEVPK